MRFLDTNVLVRFLTGTPPDQFRKSVELFRAVEQGTEQIITNYIVIFETVWVLNRSYKFPMDDIRTALLDIISLPNVRLENKAWYVRAFDLSVELNIPFADAFRAVFMQENEITEAYTWDSHFDRVDGITRIEPGAPSHE